MTNFLSELIDYLDENKTKIENTNLNDIVCDEGKEF